MRMIDGRGFPIDERWDAVEIADDEKNAAVNRIERALAARQKKNDGACSEIALLKTHEDQEDALTCPR